MGKNFPFCSGDQVSTNNKDDDPEEGFQIGRDPKHRGDGHDQSE
jgi:hypothetical protein